MTFLCGPAATELDAERNALGIWPRPWWMRCNECGAVKPYNVGIHQPARRPDNAPTADYHVCVPDCSQPTLF